MSLRKLPAGIVGERPQNYSWDTPSDILSRWSSGPQAAAVDTPGVISILDTIGEDWWTGGGFTSKRMSAALRSIGESNPVTVQINSPGGDVFEGVAIYNLLRAHKASVTVEVLGIAASAASIIAMAGDEIKVGLGSFVMIHNSWGNVVGNRHDMRAAATLFDSFDSALADIYVARTGNKRADVVAQMDAETFMGAAEAVASGYADTLDTGTPAESAVGTNNKIDRRLMARRQTEAALARAGFTRQNRSDMLSDIVDAARDAGVEPTPAARDAGIDAALFERTLSLFH